jgi:hypothetical protein
MDEKLIRRLIQYVKCSECGEPYEGHNVKVLGRCGEAIFFSVYCPYCSKRDLIAALVREVKLSDEDGGFSEEEFAILSELLPVDLKDVAEIRDFLKDFDGDFAALFLREGG